MTLGVTVAATGLFAVGSAGTAQAGGASWASCPSNKIIEVYAPPAPGQPSSGMTFLAEGYYAHIAQSWPPAAYVLCRTSPGRGPAVGEPSFRFEHAGCPNGSATFGVPRPAGGNGFGGPPVTWGSFLPQGWYDLSDPAIDQGWSSVCWSPTNRTRYPAAAGAAAPAAVPANVPAPRVT